MIDWHSHILPQMDDGSRSVSESLEMLDLMKSQGVECVVATPHFLANEESVSEFLRRRNESYKLLLESMSEKHPHVICGAEVKYYSGIGRMEELERLTVEGTKLLLLEMPVAKWTEYMIKELIELSRTRGLIIVMAHIERYMAFQSKKDIERLIDSGILMQVNAGFFQKLGTRHKAMNLLASGKIHFLGSDCHNMTLRPPNIDAAYSLIGKKFGKEYLCQMDEYAHVKLGCEI